MRRFLAVLGIASLVATTVRAQPAQENFRHASLEEICGELIRDNLPACLGKKAQYDLHYDSCVQYGLAALQTFVLKLGGKSEDATARSMAMTFAGRFNGLTLLEHLVRSAYHGNYGSSPEEFSQNAFMICMKGEPF